MKPETKETLKYSLGEFAIQIALVLIFGAFGGLGLAYVFLGVGAFWLLLPFAVLIYLAYRKFSSRP
jgi:hypothetical protein